MLLLAGLMWINGSGLSAAAVQCPLMTQSGYAQIATMCFNKKKPPNAAASKLHCFIILSRSNSLGGAIILITLREAGSTKTTRLPTVT